MPVLFTSHARWAAACGLLAIAIGLGSDAVSAQSLAGSEASLDVQNERAEVNDFTFLETRAEVARFVRAGYLEALRSNRYYVLNEVSHPVARPEVRLFVDRLAKQYYRACGEPLVVTSLTRPISEQPDNASPRSVHPTGMALDLRRPAQTACLRWLERTLLSLEARHVLEVTLEHSPPHLHVAVFPQRYAAYVRRLTHAATSAGASRSYTVRAADSLWTIARRFRTTPAALKTANALDSDIIRVGQRLSLPGDSVVVKKGDTR